MAINKKPHFRGHDFNNGELKDAKSLQLNQDATNADEAVRKSQSESIASQAAQDILVTLPQLASGDKAFTSASMISFLAGKQDNMEIDSSSTAYLQIVDGYKIKATQLLITDVEVDETYPTLASFIANTSPNKQQGDVVILTNATDNQERTWIKTGSASQNAHGYTRLQTDYNVTSIRAMFSAGDYLSFSSSTGKFSVNLGNNAGQLGSHTLPIDDSSFASATGDNILDLAKSLEALIVSSQSSSTQATAAVDNRFSSCSGVSGNDLGSFGGRFTNESTIKNVLSEAETELGSAEADRAAIRSEFASADAGLLNAINQEANTRAAADAQEAQARLTSDAIASQLRANILQQLSDEETRAENAENALDARLDVVEGGSSVSGSIAKAQADAQSFASNAVNNEAIARQSADAVLQGQIDAIADAFQYKGNVDSEGRIQHIDVNDANHQKFFENASFEKGDMYKMNADLTISFVSGNSLIVNTGDSLVSLSNCPSGTCIATDFHKWDNSESADILREGELDSANLERLNGTIQIKDNTLGREKLTADVEVDIDNKVLKSGDEMSGALKINKTVLANEGYAGGYDYAAYVKQKSVDTASLTDTQRALLVENEVYTQGSGNPLDLDYANATTSASHYKGSSSNMTVATVGTHSEGSVFSTSAAVYATGAYGVAQSTQLGVNAGGTFVAQNAATSNLGVFAFSDTAGALNNRGAYFALAPDNIDIDSYRVARVANPIAVQDVALLVDDYTGAKHAMYVNGKSEFNGKVIVPEAAADNEAVNLGMTKAKEFYGTLNVGANEMVTVNHGLGSQKLILTVWLDNEEITSSIDINKTSDNSITICNGSAEVLNNIEVCIIKLSV